ncbi:MAG: hypothetical protein K2K57_07875 [Oscillospiraceae bacterium]|nr:hypothetical protein [Oscillospiraceae bacterium]
MEYAEIIKRCCEASERVQREYDSDREYWDDFRYSFMESVVSNVIIESGDSAEKKRLLDVTEEMLRVNDEDIQNLAAVGVVEPIYFEYGYGFFFENSGLFGEKTLKTAEKIMKFYKKHGGTKNLKPDWNGIFDKLKGMDGCEIKPFAGQPKIQKPDRKCPGDLEKFYGMCGGVIFNSSSEGRLEIVSPERFTPFNPDTCGEDISSEWYIIAVYGDGECISIDLSPDRFDFCYDSHNAARNDPGSCPVVAKLFTDFLEGIIEHKGEPYWRRDGFEALGNACDYDYEDEPF